MLDPLTFFEGRCDDKATLRKLIEIANDRSRWREARPLFSEIRQKTLVAERQSDSYALTQYAFEEICAKTLFNLTNEPGPYDADSAFSVLPLAIGLGERLGISDLGEISRLLRLA
ncbi:MAG: hypothetical protein SGJ23_17290 [Alphaproteobacteria bacterium]|nr:hypothetical protein [Alphaproteobacteria bacterium]